jgi:hypothetical protein
MNKIIMSIAILFSITINSYGQVDLAAEAKKITDEATLLYKSEMASWYGTDLFLDKFKEADKVGGYFSYTENNQSKCIFVNKDLVPKVIGTISFDTTFNIKNTTTDIAERELTVTEKEYYTLRSISKQLSVKDTVFKAYKNTNLNLIPILSNGEKKVYFLTGPTQNGVVIFGNDYLVTFDKDNKPLKIKELHKNIIPIYYGKSDNKEIGGFHSHLPETGDFITPTDICTLMLYSKFTTWEQHMVKSAQYTSIWNCKNNQLTILPNDLLDKINKDQKKRKKKNRDD